MSRHTKSIKINDFWNLKVFRYEIWEEVSQRDSHSGGTCEVLSYDLPKTSSGFSEVIKIFQAQKHKQSPNTINCFKFVNENLIYHENNKH